MNAMLIHTTPVDETEGKPKICVRKMLFKLSKTFHLSEYCEAWYKQTVKLTRRDAETHDVTFVKVSRGTFMSSVNL